MKKIAKQSCFEKKLADQSQKVKIYRKRVGIACLAIAILLLAGGAFLTLQYPCVVKEMWGVPCPGCGMTRAAQAFIQGEFTEVNRWHPMFWALFPLAGYLIACIFSKKLRRKIWIALLVFGVAMVLCWVIRMILFFPGVPPMNRTTASFFVRIFK